MNADHHLPYTLQKHVRGKPLPDTTQKVIEWWPVQYIPFILWRLKASSLKDLIGRRDTLPDGRKDGNVVKLSTQVKSRDKSLEENLNEAIAG